MLMTLPICNWTLLPLTTFLSLLTTLPAHCWTWLPWTTFLPSLITLPSCNRTQFLSPPPPLLLITLPARSWTRFPSTTFLSSLSTLPAAAEPGFLCPHSCFHCWYLQLIPATPTIYFDSIYYGLPGDLLHRLLLHLWLSLSHSNPQNHSDAASSIIH